MPTKPNKTFTGNSADMINAVRNDLKGDYARAIPTADINDVTTLRAIGSAFARFPSYQNAFLNALCNRIAFEIIRFRTYLNPWSVFKAGTIETELGETIEEIFTALCEPHQYDVDVAENELYKREKPNVKTAFHPVNYQVFYKQTIEDSTLRMAFITWAGFDRLIESIIANMVKSANYDEFLVMKYMISRAILNGELHAVKVDAPTPANSNNIISEIKGVSNNLEFLSNEYNRAKVDNDTPKSEQYLISTGKFDALFSVNTLATAFNMSEADFMGHKILVDSFAKFDNARLAKLLEKDPEYKPFTNDELALLADVPAVLVSKDWFVVYDNLFANNDTWNGQGLYRNYFLHTWKIFSTSPFENAVVFTREMPNVTDITVSPATATVTAGQTVQLTAEVTTVGFASKSVTWRTDTEGVTVDSFGKVTTPTGFTGTVNVYAYSDFSPLKRGTAVLTVQ